jgi:hypothetical protein
MGDEWVFNGCLNDIVTITMQSADFGAYLELYGPIGRQSLIAASVENPGAPAGIYDFPLPDSGLFTIVATGVNIRDRGAYTLTAQAPGAANGHQAQIAGLLDDGDTVTGTVETRLGEEWAFRGCMHDAVAVTIESNDFVPYLEIFPPGGRQSLIEMNGTGSVTTIDELILPASGQYVITAAGVSIRDRGAYTLTFRILDRSPNRVFGPTSPQLVMAAEPAAAPHPTPASMVSSANPADSLGGDNLDGNQGSRNGQPPIVCNNFNGEENWASFRGNSDIYKDWYAGWGPWALDEGIYKASAVTFTREASASLGKYYSDTLSKDGRTDYSAKIASNQPYAAFFGSPRIPVPAGFEGGRVQVSVRYLIWDDGQGARVGNEEWASLLIKPGADRLLKEAPHVEGSVRGEWSDMGKIVDLGDAKDIMVMIQAQSFAPLNSNIYFDDVRIEFFSANGATQWLRDCTTAGTTQ